MRPTLTAAPRIKGHTGRASIAETPRITKPMRLEASGGPVCIDDLSAPAGGGMSEGLLEDDMSLASTDNAIAMTGEDSTGESGTAGTVTTDTTTAPGDPGVTQDPLAPGAKNDPLLPMAHTQSRQPGWARGKSFESARGHFGVHMHPFCPNEKGLASLQVL